MTNDRRDNLRVPENRLITEIVSEKPGAASIINVSHNGIFTVKSSKSGRQGPKLIQLEIPVPEASESIWALGEIVFERVGKKRMGSGIRFLNMANFHYTLLKDMVEIRRQEVLEQMMSEVRRRKELAAHPSPFATPLRPLSEDTIRMYLLPNQR
ncbi:MAG: PilZ domain-containing protein [Proteobacteria bacterium]|nr:PilZ domain-containing protein [Pseudomonadota bacterium]